MAILLLFGCAAESPPTPPRVQKPQAIKDLKVVQLGSALRISFTPPSLAVDGRGITKPLEIEVLRAVTTAKPSSGRALPVLSPWITLTAADLARYHEGQKVVEERQFTPEEFRRSVGSTFALAVSSLTRGFRRRPILSDPSNQVELRLLDVSGPVSNVIARTTEHAIQLNWSAPPATLTGAPLANLEGYRIYRSETGASGTFQTAGETKDTHYQDRDFHFGSNYYYRVRVLFKQDGQLGESADSEPLKITPLDTFPPAAPAGLTGVYTSNAIELIWTTNTEPDLAGYDVYRRDADESGAQPEKLNQNLVPTPIYRDAAVAAGRKYVYWVTAVDQARNESKASLEVTVEAQ